MDRAGREGLRRVEFSPEVLSHLGLEPGGHYEVIITSINPSTGGPNAMAAGLRCGDLLEIRVFRGSDTFEYMSNHEKVWTCIPSYDQVDLLVRAALRGHGSREAEFPPEMYVWDSGVPRLASLPALLCRRAGAAVETVSDAYGVAELMRVELTPVEALVPSSRWTAVSRASCLLLEAAIRISRDTPAGEILERARELAPPSLMPIIEEMRGRDTRGRPKRTG